LTPDLLKKLKSKIPATRDDAALKLIDFIEEAKAILIEQIMKKENENHHGTLVYALSFLNCSQNFEFAFEVLLKHKYESFIEAFAIIESNNYVLNEKTIYKCRKMYLDFIKNIDKQNYSVEEKNERLRKISAVYEWFLK